MFDASGKRYFEAMAGLWSVGLGFNEKRLVDAAYKQMLALPFYHTFSAKSHGPSIDLAEKLVALAPVPMSKVFFTNSGSEANDTVLKLIAYRSNALGQPQRKKVISRMRAYHGVTIASASLTGLPNNHRSFDLPLPNILHTGSPHFYKDGAPGESEEAFATRRAEEPRRPDPEGRAGYDRGLLRRAGDGRGRRHRAAGDLLGQDPGGPEEIRHPAGRRRGDLRLRPHRQDVRLRDLRHQARRARGLQADHLELFPVLGDHHERQDVRADRGREQQDRRARPWLHRRRPSGGLGGCAGEPQDHRGARPGCPCRRAWSLHAGPLA